MDKQWLILDSKASIENVLSLSLPDELGLSPNEWIEKVFGKHVELAGIVIPFPISTTNRIKIIELCLHIRLSPYKLERKAFITFAFIPNDNSNKFDIAESVGPYANFLLTKGISFFSSFKEFQKHKGLVNGLNFDQQSYTDFLDSIYIDKSDFVGNHSIANQWGAFRMAAAAGLSEKKLPENVRKSMSSLYFKYLNASNYSLKQSNETTFKSKGELKEPKDLDTINLTQTFKIDIGSKKVLLIDDEAEKGWKEVLDEIFERESSENFQVIPESVSSYDELSDTSRKLIESGEIDLFLVDLRLKGDQEKHLSTSDLSGAKIAKKIKTLNKGNQVIVFTASNKAWNMKELLFMHEDGYNIGVDGYYIKESPLSGFTESESKKSLDDLSKVIKESLKLSYLREIYVAHSNLIRKSAQLAKESGNQNLTKFYKRTFQNLQIAFSLILGSKTNPINMNYAFMQYFQILEDYFSLDEVYKFIDGNEYVYIGGERICVISASRGDSKTRKRAWKLKKCRTDGFPYFSRHKNEDYVLDDHKSTALAKISNILAFKHSCSNEELEHFGYLNKQRNNVAHNNENIMSDHIDAEEMKDIMYFIDVCLT